MMLSLGSCRISSRTTVNPPMPESKTPIGAELSTSPGNACTHFKTPLARAPDLDVSVEIGEVGRDIRVGAGEEMIEYDHCNPVLQVGAPGAHAIGKVLIPWSVSHYRLASFRVQHRLPIRVE